MRRHFNRRNTKIRLQFGSFHGKKHILIIAGFGDTLLIVSYPVGMVGQQTIDRPSTPERQTAVTYLIPDNVPLIMVLSAQQAFQPGTYFINRIGIKRAGRPGGTDIIISPGTPLRQFVPEDKSIRLVNQDIFPIQKTPVKLGRQHQVVVAVASRKKRGIETLYPAGRETHHDRSHIEPFGNHKRNRIAAQHSETPLQRQPFVRIQCSAVKRNNHIHGSESLLLQVLEV